MTARRGTARGRLAAGAVTLLLATAGATPAAAQVTGRGFIQAMGLIKKGAALTNRELGYLDAEIAGVEYTAQKTAAPPACGQD